MNDRVMLIRRNTSNGVLWENQWHTDQQIVFPSLLIIINPTVLALLQAIQSTNVTGTSAKPLLKHLDIVMISYTPHRHNHSSQMVQNVFEFKSEIPNRCGRNHIPPEISEYFALFSEVDCRHEWLAYGLAIRLSILIYCLEVSHSHSVFIHSLLFLLCVALLNPSRRLLLLAFSTSEFCSWIFLLHANLQVFVLFTFKPIDSEIPQNPVWQIQVLRQSKLHRWIFHSLDIGDSTYAMRDV